MIFRHEILHTLNTGQWSDCWIDPRPGYYKYLATPAGAAGDLGHGPVDGLPPLGALLQLLGQGEGVPAVPSLPARPAGEASPL